MSLPALLCQLGADLSAGVVHSTQHVVQFDSLTKLDNWKTAILLKIRQTIQEGTGLT